MNSFQNDPRLPALPAITDKVCHFILRQAAPSYGKHPATIKAAISRIAEINKKHVALEASQVVAEYRRQVNETAARVASGEAAIDAFDQMKSLDAMKAENTDRMTGLARARNLTTRSAIPAMREVAKAAIHAVTKLRKDMEAAERKAFGTDWPVPFEPSAKLLLVDVVLAFLIEHEAEDFDHLESLPDHSSHGFTPAIAGWFVEGLE